MRTAGAALALLVVCVQQTQVPLASSSAAGVGGHPSAPRPRLPVLPRFERDRADRKVLFVDNGMFANLSGDIGLRRHRPSPAGQVVLGHNYNQTVTYCLVHPDISTTSYQGSYHIQ